MVEGGGRGGPRPPEKLVEQFDQDKDGKLTGAEREAALNTRGGGNLSLMPEENLRAGVQNDVEPSLASAPEGSPSLYDAHTLRTLYLRFHHEDWYEQMNSFYRTDIEVPAELIVDGKVYPEVSAHFRGTSSTSQLDRRKSRSISLLTMVKTVNASMAIRPSTYLMGMLMLLSSVKSSITESRVTTCPR